MSGGCCGASSFAWRPSWWVPKSTAPRLDSNRQQSILGRSLAANSHFRYLNLPCGRCPRWLVRLWCLWSVKKLTVTGFSLAIDVDLCGLLLSCLLATLKLFPFFEYFCSTILYRRAALFRRIVLWVLVLIELNTGNDSPKIAQTLAIFHIYSSSVLNTNLIVVF